MVNSSWTAGHISSLWWARRAPPALVYPPCDTEELQRLPLDRRLKHLYLVGGLGGWEGGVGAYAALPRRRLRARPDPPARLPPHPPPR